MYNHAQDRPLSPPAESKLPIDHPHYSPAIHCAPKRLFASALPKRKRRAASKQNRFPGKNARQCSPSLSTDEDDVGEIRPVKAGAHTLDQELRDAGESTSL